MKTVKKTPYRLEDGRGCIDVYVHTAQQLFDMRDPAPFRERDLDEDAADYLFSAATDVPDAIPLRLVVFLEREPDPPLSSAVIESAVRAHFSFEADRVERRLTQQRRFGRVALAGGLTVLVLFLSLAEVVRGYATGPAGEILREGLVIAGWVAIWKPVEVLLYDWWPLVDHRRQIARIVTSEIEVRVLSESARRGESADHRLQAPR